MDIFTGAASSALSEIGKWVWSIAASNINYLLCYDQNVEKLKHLVRELDIKKKDIQQKVDVAKRNGRTIREDVSEWLTNLNDVEEDARRLEERVKGVRRFMGCCWDCFSSYKIGKEVAEKIATANKLLSTNFTSYSHEPPPPSIESLFPNRDFQELSSTKSSMDHIWEALNNDFFYIIGVYGMGGIGKTTIMKKVAKRAKNEGQYNMVIMVTVSQNQDIKRMQTEIAEQLGLQLTAESEIVRSAKILTRIKETRKILIILDDLWKFLDIDKIGIPNADENKECKVVITTRRRDVCSFMGCQKHIKVEPLSEKESWDLFKSKVGDVVEKTDSLTKVAMDVAKECGGLPLAIITLGRTMRDKDDINTWISIRTELQQSIQIRIKVMEDPLFKCIRLSFDYLSSNEAKLCFLLCLLFPKDQEIYIIDFFRYVVGEGILWDVYNMEAAWNKVCGLLDELKDCCLLLEAKHSEHFKMHNVVRDVAIWISSEKTYGFYVFANKGLRRWPEIRQVDDCQRISFMGNSFDSLPEQPVFPKLLTMILKETRISTIPDRFFQRMEALLVLDLRSEKVASLPSSFPCLVNLKALFLSRSRPVNFDMTSLSLIGELKNLEILQLQGFEFGTVPKEFGNLTSLRCVDLLYCTGIIPRNLISRLSRLEQLYLTDVFSNWQVDDGSSGDTAGCAATFAELASLSCLTTLHVDIENPDIFLQQDLNFVPWPELTDFNIVVGISPIRYLAGRERSKQLANKLEIKECHKFQVLPTSMLLRTHQLMKHLDIGRCDKLEKVLSSNIVQEEGQSAAGIVLLPCLESIRLLDLPELRSVWDDDGVIMLPGSLQNLQSLSVGRCKSLKDLLPPILPTPNKLVKFPSLRELKIFRCHCLTYLFSWSQAKGLPHLQRLYVDNCEKLETVIEAAATDDEDKSLAGAVLLPQLHSIQLYNLHRLTNFCDYLEDFPSLRRLDIWGCHSLTYLLSWRQAKGLPHLQRLEVMNCERMETVIKAATDDDDDKSLASVVLLPQLHSIQLYYLQGLTNFCENLEDFASLRTLDIRGCDSLTYLLSWRQAKGLPHLQILSVSDCEGMEAVIFKEEEGGATDDHSKEEEESVLPSLKDLSLDNLPMLRSFLQGEEQCSKSLSSFKSLKDLKVAECPKLKKLPLSSSTVLESLRGDNWEWFESLEWEDESIKECLRTVFQVWK